MQPSAFLPTESPGVFTNGAMKFRTNEALQAEEEARKAVLQQQDNMISDLAGHLRKCWDRAKSAKQVVERQMLKNLRQRNGIYETSKASAIIDMGGSDVYVLLTATKCRAAEAWINDILRPVGERPWAIKPTPLPDLPEDIGTQLMQDVSEVETQVRISMAQLGIDVNTSHLREEMMRYESELKDAAIRRIQDEAKSRAERMTLKIDDQLIEGGWHAAFWSVITDLVTLPAGILKGPVVRRRKVYKWVNAGGKWQVQTSDALVPEYDRVSPFDIYPSPDSSGPDSGYIFERHMMERKDLIAMIGVPGYQEDAIRKALTAYGDQGKREMLSTDSERAMIEKGNTDGLYYSEKIEAIEFWGSVQGKMLLDWGMQGDIDPELDYEVNAWLVGDFVIRAILNPDFLGRKPYSVDSFERVPGAFWGKGIPELMSDIQDVCNAVARAIVNNCGLASGPQVEVDKERCEDDEKLYPWKIWPSTNRQMADGPAVRFFQPELVVQPLLVVYETFAAMSDDQTGVPRWSHGNTNVGGAGGTSSGLSMLMTSAARGIKEVISHIDTMVSSAIRRQYDYNMLYELDESIKGDCNILPMGTASLLAKEQRIVRTQEFMRETMNPVDMQIIGIEGRARLLREAAKMLDLNVDDIVPGSEMELRKLMERIQQQAAMGQPPPEAQAPKTQGQTPKARELDVAGQPAGGVESNAFQNQEGTRT